MLEHKYGNWSGILADPQMLGMVSASVLSHILEAMLEPDEQFIPIEERLSRKRCASRDKEDAPSRLSREQTCSCKKISRLRRKFKSGDTG